MPKTNFCKKYVDPREQEVKAVIAAGMARKDLSQNDLSRTTNIVRSTLNLRLNNPRTMRLGELWDILDALHTADPDKAKLL